MSTFKVSCGFTLKNTLDVAATIGAIDTALAGKTISSITADGYPEKDGGMNRYNCEAVAEFTADSVTACASAAKTLFAAIGADNEIDYLTIDALAAFPSHTHTKSDITDFTHTHVSSDLTDIASAVTEEGTTAVTSAGIYAAIHATE